jgi:hypothetical protein
MPWRGIWAAGPVAAAKATGVVADNNDKNFMTKGNEGDCNVTECTTPSSVGLGE